LIQRKSRSLNKKLGVGENIKDFSHMMEVATMKPEKISNEKRKSRREVLKKSAFIVPTMMTLQLAEAQVAASGQPSLLDNEPDVPVCPGSNNG